MSNSMCNPDASPIVTPLPPAPIHVSRDLFEGKGKFSTGRGRYPISDPLSLKRYSAFTVDAVLIKASLHETADIFLQVYSLISFTYAFISKTNEILQTLAKTLIGNLSRICDRETVDT